MMLLAIICLIQLVIQVTLPYYHGNKLYWEKISFFEEQGEYNAVCFGSSRMYRQVDPERLNHTMRDIKLFNFGVTGAFNPESYFLFENFIDDLDSGQIKLAILELQDLDTLVETEIKTVRSSYWNKDLLYAINYINDDGFHSMKRSKALRQYIIGYVYGLTNFSKISAFEHFLGVQKSRGKDGFYSLDNQMADSHSPGLARRSLALRDSLIVNARKAVAAFPQDNADVMKANKTHLKKLCHLIDKSEKKGIELYFVIAPKLTSYQALRAIEKSIPNRVINLGSYFEYPEFYSIENSFDIKHLNGQGLKMFTDALARKVHELRGKRKISINNLTSDTCVTL
ncbi:MAG: hypothetical protein Roseis2KO_41060 [Roseivirga sp.]